VADLERGWDGLVLALRTSPANVTPALSRSDTLKVEDAKIDHEETCRRLDAGELSGFSIGGMAGKATCSICSGSYLDCDHVAGEEYVGQSCQVDVSEISLREISLVRNPVNRQAIVHRRT
jgi:hypothetical protein